MIVKVIYESEEILPELDKTIKDALESTGKFSWYAQGFSIKDERDIVFDVIEKNEQKGK